MSAPKKAEALRDDPREEDPRDRAARRVAELRGEGGSIDFDGVADKFYIPPDMIPDGWTYEWKRGSIYGKEDPTYAVELARRGWEHVPANRKDPMDHRVLVPSNWKHHHIEIDGMILMERPAEISEEFRRQEDRRARSQVSAKEQQLSDAPPGTFDRVDAKGKETKSVKKSYTPMAIPKD